MTDKDTDALSRGIAVLEAEIASLKGSCARMGRDTKEAAKREKRLQRSLTEAEADNARLRQELEGQCKISGAGSEHELSLLAKLETAEKENARLRQRIEAAQKQEPVAEVGSYGVVKVLIDLTTSEEPLPDGLKLYAQSVPAGEDARDAARYRWLRDEAAISTDNDPVVCESTPCDRECLFGEGLDSAIDAAMAASPARDGKEES